MNGFWLAWAQGIFYVVAGLWPLIHMRSFEAISGLKIDHWLVNTVGLLISVTGAVCIFSAIRGVLPPETILLAMGNALALAGIDIFYATRGRISKVYLVDSVVELILAALWISPLIDALSK